MSAAGPRWVPAFAAFDALPRHYEAINYYADDEVCWTAAGDALFRRLQSGQLPSRAASVSEEWDDGLDNDPPPWPSRDDDRKSVGKGSRVSGLVARGGRRMIQPQQNTMQRDI